MSLAWGVPAPLHKNPKQIIIFRDCLQEMSNYVVAFDIDTRQMRDDGLEGAITRVYSEVEKLLRSCGFTEKIQGSMYGSNNDGGINSLIEFIARKSEVPLFCTYAKKVHFFRCNDQSDITDKVRIHKEETMDL
jgi:virulence-associated protein VapD